MEIFLLYLTAFLRPILSVDLSFSGAKQQVMAMADWAAIVMFSVLIVAVAANLALRKEARLSPIDAAMAAFVLWCVAIYLIYVDKANAREMVKLVFPFFVYFVTKNVLRDLAEYRKMLALMIVAFVLPVVGSSVLLLLGKGVALVNYWTSEPRYEGMYDGAHSLGHNMVFLLMLLGVYVALRRYVYEQPFGKTANLATRVGCGLLVLGAVYCLIMSQTRTQLFGIIAFSLYYFFVFNRRTLYFGMAALAIVVVVFLPFITNILFFDMQRVASGTWGEEDIASGRPRIWQNNFDIYAGMPIDRKIAGVGIGNKDIFGGTEGFTDSHNDFLDVMIQTGIVGLLLYLFIQFLLLREILRLPGKEKHAFIALFIAVVLMNFASNSYITRSALAQMFFLVMSYVEVRNARQVQTQLSPSRATAPAMAAAPAVHQRLRPWEIIRK